jgi:hypothetical protein
LRGRYKFSGWSEAVLIGRVPIGVRKILAPERGARTDLARVFYKPKSRNVKNPRAPATHTPQNDEI